MAEEMHAFSAALKSAEAHAAFRTFLSALAHSIDIKFVSHLVFRA